MLRSSSVGSGKIGRYFLTCLGNFVDFHLLFFHFMICFHDHNIGASSDTSETFGCDFYYYLYYYF